LTGSPARLLVLRVLQVAQKSNTHSRSLWLLLNFVFFCTIDLNYLNTFFGTLTAPQYCVNHYHSSKDDAQKWDIVFSNRIAYTKEIHDEVKVFVADNISTWKQEHSNWFKIEMMQDEFLPVEVFEEEGGAERRRSSFSIMHLASRKMTSMKSTNSLASSRVHPT